MEQLSAIVIGAPNSGKSQLISTTINIPLENFDKNIPFQELKNENIPVSFIEANNFQIPELENELDLRSKNQPIQICWYVLPGSIQQLTSRHIDEITCLSQYFPRIIFVFTDVLNMMSSIYSNILKGNVQDPAIALLTSNSNPNTSITYESSFTSLIISSYTLLNSQELQEKWQILIDLRQRRIFHGVEQKPEKVNFHGMELIVQDTDIGHLNIILAGQVGAGKSSLINAILGKEVCKEGVGQSVTDAIKEIDVENMPITIIDSPGFELGDGQTNFNNLINLITERKRFKEVSKHIHLLWYCINESSHRVQGVDTHFIQNISKLIPVFIVITQAVDNDRKKSNELTMLQSLKQDFPGAATYSDFIKLSMNNAPKFDFNNLCRSNIAIHRLAVKPTTFNNVIVQKSFGLSEFIDLHRYYLDRISRYVFNTSQEIEFEAKKETAKEYIIEFSRIAVLMNCNKPIRASDAKNYKPTIQEMLIGISRRLDIPIQEGSISILSSKLFEGEKDHYQSFRDTIGLFMGMAEKTLSSTGNAVLNVIGRGIGVVREFLFPQGKTESLDVMLKTIGNNYLNTVVCLKKSGQELNLDNFMKIYTENFQHL